MGRRIQPGTIMDVTQDAPDVATTLLTNEKVVLEQETISEGRSKNTNTNTQLQLQLQIAVSEPVQSSNVEESVETQHENTETDGAARLEGSQILTTETTNKRTESDEIVTRRLLPVVSLQEEFPAGNEAAAAKRGLSLETGSTSSCVNGDAHAVPTHTELELGLKAGDVEQQQLRVSGNNKRPAVCSPQSTGPPLWWDAYRLAEPRGCKRSGADLLNRHRQACSNNLVTSSGPNFSRWESINCETRTHEPHSSQCSLIELRAKGNSDDSTNSMQVDPVRVSPSREMSPEPTVIPLEERQQQLHRQAIEMRMRRNRTRPAPVPGPASESSSIICCEVDNLGWIRRGDRRNERERQNSPEKDFTERYNFDIHRDLPLEEGRWEWENIEQA